MGNIINYVKEFGKYSFLDRPFGVVDSLVLATLSYLKYDDFLTGPVTPHRKYTFKYLIHERKIGKLFRGLLDVPSNGALLWAVANSKRFGKTQIKYYVNQLEEEKESQFSALVFFLENEIPFVAFRGTDESIIGWKEDFNMAFLSPVPAQEKALAYLKKVTRKMNGEFYVGGHSKGGNISVFASAMIDAKTQERIRTIYSLEGPGFKEVIFEDKNFLRITKKIVKIIPKSSIIGMLLEHQENYTVVKSSKNGLLQHDPFTWIVENGDFLYLEDIDRGAMVMNHALNQWIQGMEDNERMELVNTIFDILGTTEMGTMLDLADGWKRIAREIMAATRELDEETRKFLWETIVQLIRMGTRSLLDVREEERENVGRKMEKLIKKN